MSGTSVSIFPCKVHMELSCKFHPAIIRLISKHKAKRHQTIRNRNLQLLGASLRLKNTDRDKNLVVCCSVGPGPSIPSNPGPGSCRKLWVLGILLSIALPFWKSKSGPLLKLKDEVETVIDKVEAVTNVAEKVAEKVEEVADDIGNYLPEGRLKHALDIVEDVAQNTAEGAHLTGEFIDKVEEVQTVVDKVEAVTDITEKVAEQVEEVADDIGNYLPEGRLKDALEIVEDMAKNTADGARFTGEFIEKVEEVEEQVKSWMGQNSTVEEVRKQARNQD